MSLSLARHRKGKSYLTMQDWLDDYSIQQEGGARVSGASNRISTLFAVGLGIGAFADQPLQYLFQGQPYRQKQGFLKKNEIDDDKIKAKVNDVIFTHLKELFSAEAQHLIRQAHDEKRVDTLQDRLNEKEQVFTDILNQFRDFLRDEIADDHNPSDKFKNLVYLLEMAVEPYQRRDEGVAGIENIPKELAVLIEKLQHREVKKTDEDTKAETEELCKKYHEQLQDLEGIPDLGGPLQMKRANFLLQAQKGLLALVITSRLEGPLLEKQLENYVQRIENFDRVFRRASIQIMSLQSESKQTERPNPEEKIPANFLLKADAFFPDFLEEPYAKGKLLIADLRAVLGILAAQQEASRQAKEQIAGSFCGRFFSGKTLAKLGLRQAKLATVRGKLEKLIARHPEFAGLQASDPRQYLEVGAKAIVRGDTVRSDYGSTTKKPKLERIKTLARILSDPEMRPKRVAVKPRAHSMSEAEDLSPSPPAVQKKRWPS